MRAARWLGYIVAAAGAAVLAGWWLGIEVLTHLSLPNAQMKSNTAFALAMSGLSLARCAQVGGTRSSCWAARLASALVVAIGALTLIEWGLGADLGVDTLLAGDARPRGGFAPGRMAPTTALCLTLVGAAQLLLGGGRRASGLAHVLALVSGLIALVGMIGHLYGVGPTLGLARYTTQMAVHTALSFLVLSLGVQLARPDHGLVRLATSDRAAGVVVRRLFPAALLLPIVIGWIRLEGQRAGLYDTELGLALYCTANVTILATLVAWIASVVDRQDEARRDSDRRLREAHDHLEIRVEERTAALRALNQRLHGEVAERERAQEAERASTELIKLTLDSADHAVITTSLDGTIVGFNPEAERLLGWRAGEVIGQVTPAVFHDPDEVVARAAQLTRELGVPVAPGPDAFLARLRNGLPEEAEWTYVRKDGGRLPVLLSVTSLRDGAGEPRGYVGIARDQSERRRADAEVRELRRAFEYAVEGVARLDREGRYVAANAAYAAMLGCASEELIGLSWAQTIDADDLDLIRDDKVERETVGIRHDGTTFDERVVLVAVHDEQGQPAGHYCFSKDITAQKQGERDLRAAKRAAETAMRARSDFLARMSHEIRTPMNGVLGMIDLALKTELTAQQRDFIHTANMSATSLLRLIDDILDFAKIDAGHLSLARSSFRLRSCLGATMKSLAHRARTKGLDLVIDVPPSVPERLVGDPQRLGQILINLIGNAIKFTERGSIRLSLVPAGDQGGDPVLRFAVADTGVGIPLDKHAVIFEDFNQADHRVASRYGGTGLGLAISRQLVQLMHGEIGVDSEPGRGSTFWFTARMERDDSAESEGDPVQGLRGSRVLVIDDQADRRRTVCDLLEAWEMHPCGTRPDQVAQTAGDHDFALIHGDVVEREGDAWLSALTLDVPLILVGSMLSGRDCLSGRAGAVVPLLWPLTASTLQDAVASALDPSRRPAGRAQQVSTPGSARGLRVLLAEDHPVNRKLAVAVLERAGYEVVAVEDGRAAVAAAERGGFDLLLMDVQMPVMDGLTASRLIRERERARGGRLPIIALTAQAMREERERGFAAGVDGYVSKPFQAEALLAEIGAVVVRSAGWRTSDDVSAQVASAAERAPVFDRDRALRQIDGDEELLAELVEIFLADVVGKREAMRAALAAEDSTLLARTAHSLRGALLTLAALPAAQVAREIEESVESGATAAAAAMALEFELQLLMEELGRAVP
jgi:hypothetical protein